MNRVLCGCLRGGGGSCCSVSSSSGGYSGGHGCRTGNDAREHHSSLAPFTSDTADLLHQSEARGQPRPKASLPIMAATATATTTATTTTTTTATKAWRSISTVAWMQQPTGHEERRVVPMPSTLWWWLCCDVTFALSTRPRAIQRSCTDGFGASATPAVVEGARREPRRFVRLQALPRLAAIRFLGWVLSKVWRRSFNGGTCAHFVAVAASVRSSGCCMCTAIASLTHMCLAIHCSVCGRGQHPTLSTHLGSCTAWWQCAGRHSSQPWATSATSGKQQQQQR